MLASRSSFEHLGISLVTFPHQRIANHGLSDYIDRGLIATTRLNWVIELNQSNRKRSNAQAMIVNPGDADKV
jgi:hypothetical protein